jgi:hypothetical protein
MKSRAVDIIVGKTGSGKTTLARELVAPLTRCLILDVGFNEFNAQEIYTLDELADYLEARGRIHGFFKVSYTPLSHEYPTLFKMARLIGQQEPLTLVLEEADTISPPSEMAEYDELISRGRHYGVNMLAVTLYPFKVPPELRRQATAFYSFTQHEPRDLQYLSDVYGPEHVDKIAALPPYHYLKWTRESITEGHTKKYE